MIAGAVRSEVEHLLREMVLGRLVHWTADALMVSTVLAGVKRASGLSPDTERFMEPNVKMALQKYLAAGDFIFDSTLSFAQNSQFFHAPPELSLFGDSHQKRDSQSSPSVTLKW